MKKICAYNDVGTTIHKSIVYFALNSLLCELSETIILSKPSITISFAMMERTSFPVGRILNADKLFSTRYAYTRCLSEILISAVSLQRQTLRISITFLPVKNFREKKINFSVLVQFVIWLIEKEDFIYMNNLKLVVELAFC